MDTSVKELRSEIGAIRKSEDAVEKIREEMTALCKTVSRAALDAGDRGFIFRRSQGYWPVCWARC